MDLSGWAPPEWWDNHRLSQEWLRREFGGEKADMYEPVLEELELDEPMQEDLEAVGQRASGLGWQRGTQPSSKPSKWHWMVRNGPSAPSLPGAGGGEAAVHIELSFH